jgi:uncharacterized protein
MSNRLISLAAATAATIALACPAAEAASYNCAKAKTPDEIAICTNPALSDLDTQMATLYGVRMQIPMLMGARGAAQDEQRAFLAVRSSCGANVACIKTVYQQRIAVLSQIIAAAMQDYCVRLGICG